MFQSAWTLISHRWTVFHLKEHMCDTPSFIVHLKYDVTTIFHTVRILTNAFPNVAWYYFRSAFDAFSLPLFIILRSLRIDCLTPASILFGKVWPYDIRDIHECDDIKNIFCCSRGGRDSELLVGKHHNHYQSFNVDFGEQ